MKKTLGLLLVFFLVGAAISCGPLYDGSIVYVTATGSKFHRSTCSYLDSSKSSISRADALAAGYTACSVCDP